MDFTDFMGDSGGGLGSAGSSDWSPDLGEWLLGFQQSAGFPYICGTSSNHFPRARVESVPLLPPMRLSPRERQVLETLHRIGRATVAEIVAAMPEHTSYAAVRAALRMLDEKKQVTHQYEGPRYVYEPTTEPETARKEALEHLVTTFFAGSVKQAMAALLDLPKSGLPATQRKRLAKLIAEAEKEGR
jgi:BlaI family transcriptional regulator, penicillinase repressor